MFHAHDEIVTFVSADSIHDVVEGEFHRHRRFLSGLLPLAGIEHIGSTAIPGSLTKGDLDIQVRVPANQFEAAVEQLAHHYAWNEGNAQTATFASFKDDAQPVPLGIQVTAIGSDDDVFYLCRDALRGAPELVAEYNEIKRNFNGQSMDGYREAKAAFFEALKQAVSASADTTVRVVDTTDVAALKAHVQFEEAHGRARFDVDELRAWLPTVDAALLLTAEDASGRQVGCATAAVMRVLPGSMQINAFCLPGRSDVLRVMADKMARWSREFGATELMAHVSDPTADQEREWLEAGFACVGTRARVERAVAARDLKLGISAPLGMEIVALAKRPELEERTLHVWNESHLDIPSALPFAAIDVAQWRADLEIAGDDPFPASLLVAVTEDGDVAGVVYLETDDDGSGVGRHRFTGVARAWRGRGVGAALKVAIIRWAAANGIKTLRASNDAANAPMRAINDKLGYAEQFRIIMFSRPAGWLSPPTTTRRCS